MSPAAVFVLVTATLGFAILIVLIGITKRRNLPPQPFLDISYPRSRVYLTRRENVIWEQPSDVRNAMETLTALGYSDAGHFEIEENPGELIWLWINPFDSITAALSFHKLTERDPAEISDDHHGSSHEAGQRYKLVDLEIATHYRDGTSFGVLAGAPSSWASSPPHWTSVRLEHVNIEHAHRLLLRLRPNRPVIPDSIDNAASEFERRYARIMDWRNSVGGYSEAEIRKLCFQRRLVMPDRAIADCCAKMRRFALGALRDCIAESYLAHLNVDDEELDRLLDRLVIVHDQMEPDTLIGCFRSLGQDPGLSANEIRDRFPNLRAGFGAINDRLSGPRFEFQVALTEPVEANIYLRPDG